MVALEAVFDHADSLNKTLREMTDQGLMNYYFLNGYADNSIKIEGPSQDGLQRAIIVHGQAIGYISATISQAPSRIKSLDLFVKPGNGLYIIRALSEFFNMMFRVYGMTKINWAVAIGNPAGKIYERFSKGAGARELGIYHDDAVTLEGELVSIKVYEVMRDEYENSEGFGDTYQEMITPENIYEFRDQKCRMDIREFADVFDVGENDVVAWENGWAYPVGEVGKMMLRLMTDDMIFSLVIGKR